jgi:hypothetical protein
MKDNQDKRVKIVFDNLVKMLLMNGKQEQVIPVKTIVNK